jgi:hypothetical protein
VRRRLSPERERFEPGKHPGTPFPRGAPLDPDKRQHRISVLLLLVGLPLIVVAYFVVLKATKLEDVAPMTVRLGAESIVFDWSEDACETNDVPDLPARAFRDVRGRVHLHSASLVNYRFVGPTLNRLAHPCTRVTASGRNADPAAFDDVEWLASPYSVDGRTVYALVHNEYHGHEHQGRCPSGEYVKCWYNSITLAESRDGGRTFSDARPPPRHLIASIPYRYTPDVGPIGILEPSNIVRNREDQRYYFLARTEHYRAQERGACLFRTSDLADPTSWRAWDGGDFGTRLVSPYSARADAAKNVCKPVAPHEISIMSQSLTYNTYFNKYVLVGSTSDAPPGGTPVHGFYYSTSDDLIHWSSRHLIMPAEFVHTFRCGDPDPVAYPSLLDPRSESRNFETTGKRVYLYFTRFNYKQCLQTQDRNLVRVPIEFSR